MQATDGSLTTTGTYAIGVISPTTALANNTGASNTDRITSADALVGTGIANATATIKNGTTVLGTTTADGSGHWAYTPAGLADGAYTLTAPETNASGAVGKASLTFTLDTTPPKPFIQIITGNMDGGVTLAGTSEANSTVTVTDTASGTTTTLGTATASARGAWSLTSHAAINTATINSYAISAVDAAGNSGAMAGKLFLADTGVDTLTSTPA